MKRLFIIFILVISDFYPPETEAQELTFQNFISCYSSKYPYESIATYTSIYILRFEFCTSPKFCGFGAVHYLAEKPLRKEKVLVILPDSSYIDTVRAVFGNRQDYVIRYIPAEIIEKFGIFSVYTVYINKRRKVKRLK